MSGDRFIVDESGRIILDPELAAALGLFPGASGRLAEQEDGFFLGRPVQHLARIYIEPTNHCNLDCRTCLRQEWTTSQGLMGREVFASIVRGVERLVTPPTLVLGGYGEPLFHPDIVWMVSRAKKLGVRVEMITNGILLKDELARGLLDAGIDFIWVSLDGATPESYADVRLGAALPVVLENLERFRHECILDWRKAPGLGISFVALKRNIADLPALIELGGRLGVAKFSVSNVEAYTEAMQREILYADSIGELRGVFSISLPRLGAGAGTGDACKGLVAAHGWSDLLTPDRVDPGPACPFVRRGSVSVRWDGRVSPCLPLLYTHTVYLDVRVRRQEEFHVGSLLERDLLDIWQDVPYQAQRERLLNFEFAPCLTCNSCELADLNGEDCFGNVHPSCGGCLWAYGFIQCP